MVIDSVNILNRRASPMLAALSILIIIVLVSSAAPAALAKDYMISNSKDWRDIYLVGTAAALSNQTLLFFSNLGEAELTMKMIPSDSEVTVYEPSAGSVVKNYERYLELNGKQASSFTYDNYGELQSRLFGRGYDGYILLDPTFGIEAITSAPITMLKKYPPLFLTADTLNGVKGITSGKEVLLAGRIPIRLVNHFPGAAMITGMYDENVVELVRMSYEAKPDNTWGIIGKIDRVDMDILVEGNPILMYYGDRDTIVKSLNATPKLTNFEVISGDMADMARSFEVASGRDLKLILKFAQTYTNLPGQTGKLYDLNTVAFDYPIEDVAIESVKYYPELGIIAITFRNRGNIDISFFTAVEFSGNALIDGNIHTIAPGNTMTIPYALEGAGEDITTTVINTRYGMRTPFRKAIESEDGSVVLTKTASIDNTPSYNFSLELISADYYDSRGSLVLKIKNPSDNSIVAFAEILLSENSVLSSPLKEIGAGEEANLVIDTPYLTAADLTSGSYKVTFYYGVKDTLLTQTFDVVIVQKRELITSLITMVGTPAVMIPALILAVILLIILFFFILKRRKKDGKHGRARKRF